MDAEARLARARVLVRQGLLADADRLLEPLARAGVVEDDSTIRAHALLLRGNVAFERGAFEVAGALYEEVTRIQGVGSLVEHAARQNAARARDLLARSHRLSERAARLGLVVVLVTVVGGACCVILARRATT